MAESINSGLTTSNLIVDAGDLGADLVRAEDASEVYGLLSLGSAALQNTDSFTATGGTLSNVTLTNVTAVTGTLNTAQIAPVATIAIIGGDSTTDATAKSFRMGARHYTNSEEPVSVFVVSSSSTTNAITYGGGSAVFNAATQLAFNVAANNTTTTGTKMLDLQLNILAFTDACNVSFGTSTGTKLGTSTTQKIGFWNATPVVQQVLATGTGATVDNVITLLQTLGLCKQS
jgi:hypothetical protein